MTRLQKKCFLASAGFHLLLVLIVIVGPGFLSSKTHTEEMAILDCIPANLLDASISGGGNRHAQPPPAPAPQPPTPAPTPIVQKPPEPEPVKEPPKPKVIDPDLPEPKPTKKLPQVSTKPVLRDSAAKTTKPLKETTPVKDNQARQEADARRRLAQMISSTARSLNNNLTSTTVIDTNPGPGVGGEAYANYAQVVRSIYEHAWSPPEDTANDDAIT